jgi:hypothetical protein
VFRKWFIEHPSSVGEDYFEHQRMALSFALPMIAAGCACVIHAFIPGLFVRTGSRTIADLHQRMVLARGKSESKAASGLGREPA